METQTIETDKAQLNDPGRYWYGQEQLFRKLLNKIKSY
jgi:hypothetical protein